MYQWLVAVPDYDEAIEMDLLLILLCRFSLAKLITRWWHLISVRANASSHFDGAKQIGAPFELPEASAAP